ncbi:MAG: hypothetical protein OEW15_11730 [Nitrospirota bacterium]|nr:hypothetical protein [Nitrospirota bacterium]
MKLILLFLTSLPDLIKLLQIIDKTIQKGETDRKVKDDLKVLHQAFADKDGAKVTALFMGEAPPDDIPRKQP